MRYDMKKVVVEPPRSGGRWDHLKNVPRTMKQRGEEWEFYRQHEGMRYPYRDHKSLLGFHIKSHLYDRVHRYIFIKNDTPWHIPKFSSGPKEVFPGDLWVDPRDGILRQTPHVRRERGQWYKGHPVGWPNRPGRRVLDDYTQLHWIKGVWYRVHVEKRDRVTAGADAMGVSLPSLAYEMYGHGELWAVSKKQLNKKEKRYYQV